MHPGKTRLFRLENNVNIVVVDHGGPKWLGELALRVLADAYRLGGPEYLELHIYPSREAMALEVIGDGLRVGSAVAAVYDVIHEAWHGYPRIHVSGSTPREQLRPLLLHEAMHALLHGSLEYYMPPCTGDIIAIHVAATVVKDLEVSVEMYRRGFADELQILASMLRTGGDCCKPETVSDELRRYVTLLPLGVKQDTRCVDRSVVELLEKVFREAVGGRRVWGYVCRVAEAIEKTMC